ncbi:hypothetical protein [Arcobacter aquimarinus]|uniref:Uncharacterized protein n=1 Tax=Arcobacter aquimarinus TaxID=1315211 RepID=A0AAE7B0F6_9BACT|nr:hypothetical protein [Arcobacter aquimarinus]QKE25138.1 hypothetical protein AAQM_0365 [Arcobacter aquimarinus]RXI36411.1 hypothetical protein CP986_02280 [Arcobacter aquimarinus]
MQITSFTNNNYNTSNKTSNLEKTKNNDFESLISSTKSTNETTTQKTEEKDIIVDKSSTQSLYEDIISLLRTGFTVGELKAFEERLKQILKMKEDKDSGKEISIKDIEAALKQLEMEILEAKKNRIGEVIKKASDDTASPSNSNLNSNFDTTLSNITNMLQEIKTSSKNTKQDFDNNKEYDRLRLLLKMS